jgi:hypothetical protein
VSGVPFISIVAASLIVDPLVKGAGPGSERAEHLWPVLSLHGRGGVGSNHLITSTQTYMLSLDEKLPSALVFVQ